MSRLPERIQVSVKNDESSMPVAGILVSVQLFWRGQPYYADLIGLTDSRGLAEISRSTLERDFENDQQLFPMDYKESLDLCDPMIEIVIRGSKEFSKQREAVRGSSFVSDDVRFAYEEARNQYVRGARERLTLLDPTRSSLTVDLGVGAVNDMDGA